MKELVDTCVWVGVRKTPSETGHDVVRTGDGPTDVENEEARRIHQAVRRLLHVGQG